MKTYTIITETDDLISCALYYKDNVFIGTAQCHEDDMDMRSSLTGGTIAEARAQIKLYQHIKNNEIKPALKALKQLYYSMNRSKHFNKKSYESKMLYRQIRLKEKELATTNEFIVDAKESLKEYLKNKEEIHQQIRERRLEAANK